MISAKTHRNTRFSIRATARQKALIERAAQRVNKTISQFMLDNSIEAAESLEMDNADFILSTAAYETFLAALDEPPRNSSSLHKFLTSSSVIDDPKESL